MSAFGASLIVVQGLIVTTCLTSDRNPYNPIFRKINLQNQAFQSRVAATPGGLDKVDNTRYRIKLIALGIN